MSKLEEFLATQRRRSVPQNTVFIAPSPMDRYGMRQQPQKPEPLPTYPGPLRPGMGQMLGNTGAGPDGVVQPDRPVAMVDAGAAGYEGGRQGKQMVHEGEDIMRGPGGDIQVMPAHQSRGGPTITPPGAVEPVVSEADQKRLASIEKKLGMPGMAAGTSPFGPQKPKLPMIGQAAGAAATATATAAPVDFQAPTMNLAENIDPKKGGVVPGPYQVPDNFPTAPSDVPVYVSANNQRTTGDMSTQEMTIDPRTGAYTSPTPAPTVMNQAGLDLQTGQTAGGETGDLAEARGTVYSPSKIDQAILNYYQPRLAASQNAERAAEAQAMQQQGVTPETMRGTQAVSDVSRRDAMGEAVGKMGMEAMQSEEDRQKQAFSNRMAERQQRLTEQQYEDTQQTRLTTDITSGMTFEQAQAKYPDLTRESYDSAFKVANWGKTQSLMTTLANAGGEQNYGTINRLLEENGLAPIDWTDIINAEQAGKWDDVATSAAQMLAALPDTPEAAPMRAMWGAFFLGLFLTGPILQLEAIFHSEKLRR